MTQPLLDVVAALDAIAPLTFAETWDNVGLLLPGRADARVTSALFTIDLTTAVTDEVIERKADLVVAYHPPIFKGFTRLRREVPMEHNVLSLIERGVALYSPHTALDTAPNGLNDWLASLAGSGVVTPLVPSPIDPRAGAGRLTLLAEPTDATSLAERIREGTAAPHVRLADTNPRAAIHRVAVAAGAGGSLFERAGNVPATNGTRTLFVSGELRHHDVLAFTERGHAVLLLEHDASERGFLPMYRARLELGLATPIETSVARAEVDLVRALP